MSYVRLQLDFASVIWNSQYQTYIDWIENNHHFINPISLYERRKITDASLLYKDVN